MSSATAQTVESRQDQVLWQTAFTKKMYRPSPYFQGCLEYPSDMLYIRNSESLPVNRIWRHIMTARPMRESPWTGPSVIRVDRICSSRMIWTPYWRGRWLWRAGRWISRGRTHGCRKRSITAKIEPIGYHLSKGQKRTMLWHDLFSF